MGLVLKVRSQQQSLPETGGKTLPLFYFHAENYFGMRPMLMGQRSFNKKFEF